MFGQFQRNKTKTKSISTIKLAKKDYKAKNTTVAAHFTISSFLITLGTLISCVASKQLLKHLLQLILQYGICH